MKIFYIHGFNSSGRSNTVKKLRETFDINVIPLEWQCDASYEENLESLHKQIEWFDHSDFIIIGTSMGGFYADHLNNFLYLKGVVLFNPIINPVKQLSMFLGYNKNFSTGEEYELTTDILNSYSKAVDNNETIQKIVYLGKHDDLLDNQEAEKHYKNKAHIEWIDAGHRINNFEPYKNDILEMFNLIGG